MCGSWLKKTLFNIIKYLEDRHLSACLNLRGQLGFFFSILLFFITFNLGFKTSSRWTWTKTTCIESIGCDVCVLLSVWLEELLSQTSDVATTCNFPTAQESSPCVCVCETECECECLCVTECVSVCVWVVEESRDDTERERNGCEPAHRDFISSGKPSVSEQLDYKGAVLIRKVTSYHV